MAWIKRFGRSNSSNSESVSFSKSINEFAKEFKDKFNTSIFGQRAETLNASMNQFVRGLKDKCLSKCSKVTVTSGPIAGSTDCIKCDEKVMTCVKPTLNVALPSLVAYSNSLSCNDQSNNVDMHASDVEPRCYGNYLGGLEENEGDLLHTKLNYRSYHVPSQKVVTSLKLLKHNKGSRAYLLKKSGLAYPTQRLKSPIGYSKYGNKYGKHRWPPPPVIPVLSLKLRWKLEAVALEEIWLHKFRHL